MPPIKATSLIKLPIISVDTGEKINTVEDVLYDMNSNTVKGLLVDSGGWFSDAKVILTQNIQNIGEDAVMIASASAISKAKDVGDELAQIAEKGTYLTKTKVITEDGKQLGQISDIYFQFPGGVVEQFEVSQSLVKDAAKGKSVLAVSDIVNIGKDATIVRAGAAQTIEEQPPQGGVAGAAQQAKGSSQSGAQSALNKLEEITQKGHEKIQSVIHSPSVEQKVETAKAKTQEVGLNIKEKTQQAGEKTQEKVQATQEQQQEKTTQDAVGKYVTKNILAQNDEILAKRGDMITHQLIERAKQEGIEQEIYNSTSAEPVAG